MEHHLRRGRYQFRLRSVNGFELTADNRYGGEHIRKTP